MDPSQVISREYQLQAIDDEIKSLEESIRTLRYRRNALVPISSLPTEVITTIFSFFHLSTFTSGKPDPLAWLRVTHVSHQWREIALNQPLFWNHVNFTTLSSAGAAEILARAKTAPLFLEARIPGRHLYNKAIQRELQRCVTRICDLRIRATPWDLRETLESLISPAPTLECLSLSSEKRGLEVTIPETLFGGTTPRLSSLELRNCDISWESPLLKALDTSTYACHPRMRDRASRFGWTHWVRCHNLCCLPFTGLLRGLIDFHLMSSAPSHFLPLNT